MSLGFMNIGTQEMVLIVIVILLLFGGKKLPELARGLGKGIREFKDASEGIKREISDQINNFEKDLDVAEEQKPATTNTAELAQEQQAQEQPTPADEPAELAQTEPKAEKKPLPTFSAPENTYQHNPGEQPSSSDQHYTYGYNDHFAAEDAAKADDATATEAPQTKETSKNA